MKKALFIGHSHLKALEKAYFQSEGFEFKAEFLQCGLPAFKPNFRKRFFSKSKFFLNRKIKKRICKSNSSHIFLTIFGNSHNIIGSNNGNIPYDFIHPKYIHRAIDRT